MGLRGCVAWNIRSVWLLLPVKLGIASWVMIVGNAFCPCIPAVGEELIVEIQVFPRVPQGAISPYIFGAGIDHKTNPLRAPMYPEKVLRDIEESGLRIARYPGGFVFNRDEHRGSWANFYWQDHIGQYPERQPT